MSSLTKQIETKVNNEENKKANLLQLLTEENKNKLEKQLVVVKRPKYGY